MSFNLPMNWDAQNPLHGGKDFGHFLWTPINSMFRNDNGLVDIYNNRRSERFNTFA